MSHSTRSNQVAVPLVYGTIAFWLGKKAENENSHKWVAYVRGPNNEDISYFVDKVVFYLHPSFKNPVRTVSNFPFEIHESGWGEFEILIKIYFKGDFKEPLDVFHNLRLYHTHSNASHSSKKPVVSEFYDEVVFMNPSDKFYKALTENKRESKLNAMQDDKMYDDTMSQSTSIQDANLAPYFTKFDDKAQKQLLEDACAYVDNEIETLKKRIAQCDGEITRFKQNSK